MFYFDEAYFSLDYGNIGGGGFFSVIHKLGRLSLTCSYLAKNIFNFVSPNYTTYFAIICIKVLMKDQIVCFCYAQVWLRLTKLFLAGLP